MVRLVNMRRLYGMGLVALVLLPAVTRADSGLEARLLSPSRPTRMAAIAELKDWHSVVFKKYLVVSKEERVKLDIELKALESYTRCSSLLPEALDAVMAPKPAEGLALLREWADGVTDKPYEYDGADELMSGCGNGSPVEDAFALVAKRRPDLYRTLLTDPTVNCKGYLLGYLAAQKHEEDRALVLRFFRSPNSSLRAAAVCALTHYPSPETTGHLLLATRDRSGPVRSAAASALEDVPAELSTEALVRLLGDRYVEVVMSAFYALTDRPYDKRIEAALLRLATGTPTRQRIAWDGLKKFGGRAALPAMLARFKSREENAEEILVGIGGVDVPVARRVVFASLRHGNPKVRAAAYNALDKMRGASVDAALLEGLEDSDSDVVCRACYVIGKRKLMAAVPLLEEIVRQDKEETRWFAKRAINICRGLPEYER